MLHQPQIEERFGENQSEIRRFLNRWLHSDVDPSDTNHALFYRKLEEIQSFNRAAINRRLSEIKQAYDS